MKRIHLILATFVLTIFSITVISAQTVFEVPQNISLKVKEDYPKYEAAIIDAAKWLEATDLNKEIEKRKEVNSFVFQWTQGCPYFDVILAGELSKIYGENKELLVIYMASFSKCYLENKSTASQFDETKAGLISIMNVYKKGIDMTRSKEMEKLIKASNENKLDDFIKDKFK